MHGASSLTSCLSTLTATILFPVESILDVVSLNPALPLFLPYLHHSENKIVMIYLEMSFMGSSEIILPNKLWYHICTGHCGGRLGKVIGKYKTRSETTRNILSTWRYKYMYIKH